MNVVDLWSGPARPAGAARDRDQGLRAPLELACLLLLERASADPVLLRQGMVELELAVSRDEIDRVLDRLAGAGLVRGSSGPERAATPGRLDITPAGRAALAEAVTRLPAVLMLLARCRALTGAHRQEAGRLL